MVAGGATVTVVLVVLAAVTISNQAGVVVRSGILTPTQSILGQESPNIYLSINYTGVGTGSFTYVLTYTVGGNTTTQSQSVQVKSYQPFTYYLYVPPPVSSAAALQVQVYRGSSTTASHLVYQNTILL